MSATSLRNRLTVLVIAVMMAVLIPLGVLSYRRELREMNELLDGRLAQSGRTVGALIEHIRLASGATLAAPGSETVVNVHRSNFESEVSLQAYDPQMRPLAATVNLADLPAPAAGEQGFRDIVHAGERWRLFTLRNRAGLTIRIGERYNNREDITGALILEHGLPLLIGLPLLVVLAGWAVRRGLRPLDRLTEQLAGLTPGRRRPLAIEGTPREIRPLIATLNHQLGRLEDAIEREHRFNADVAHELRTPLAATMIHLESAAIADDRAAADFALRSAQQSLARLARRIEQVMALARLEAGAAAGERSPQDLVALATEVIEEFAPLIAEKDIALGLACELPQLHVNGHEAALVAMLRNLVENALRYVEPGGQVEVTLRRYGAAAVIEVADDGPGVPPEKRETIFQRFHREAEHAPSGYGLGLSIVQRAAELHQARIDLLDAPGGRGLLVRIVIPLEPPAPPR